MFYQANREQAIVDDLYIESIWLLQCPTANRWRRKARKKEREYGETTIIYLAHQQPTTSQHWSVTTADIMHFLSSPNKNSAQSQTRVIPKVTLFLLFARSLWPHFRYFFLNYDFIKFSVYVWNHHYHWPFCYIFIHLEPNFISKRAFKFKMADVLPLWRSLRLLWESLSSRPYFTWVLNFWICLYAKVL